MGDYNKRDLERVRGEWRKTAKDRRSLKLLTENIVRENEKRKDKKDDSNRGQAQAHP